MLATTNRLVSMSPTTGEPIGEIAATPPDRLSGIMDRARTAQPRWDQIGLRHRLDHFRRLKAVIYQHRAELVDLISAENGKSAPDALVGEVWPTLETISFYLRHAERILRPRRVFSYIFPHRTHVIEHRAHGVVLVISPWNYPLYLASPPIISALIAGNTVIFKPSEFSPQFGQKIVDLFHTAGFPPDVIQVAHGTGETGAGLIALKPDKICFTGSVPTGRKVAKAAGEQLIPVTLELGGKDAAIVLEDADLTRAANGIAWASMHNSGQACASVERVYVQRSIMNAFTDALVEAIRAHATVGESMGAITTDGQLRIIESHVDEAVAHGARLVTGGKRADRAGRFYEPTVITNLTGSEKVVREETFGPVIALLPCDSPDHAVELANDSPFGLLGSVWTRDTRKGMQLARRLKVGAAAVNDHIMSASLPSLPWGGRKDSGYGRTRGAEGLLDMTVSQVLSAERFTGWLKTELPWYPYTPGKYGLIQRVMAVLYAPTLKRKFAALYASNDAIDRERGSTEHSAGDRP